MIVSDDEESFLVPAETENSQKDKVWCRINEQNELEYVDWDMVDGFAKQFDASVSNERTEHMLIAKLMWSVREQTIEACKRGHL